jgi:hypothetical protein
MYFSNIRTFNNKEVEMVVRDNDCEFNCERIMKPITLEAFTFVFRSQFSGVYPAVSTPGPLKILFRPQNDLYFGNNAK